MYTPAGPAPASPLQPFAPPAQVASPSAAALHGPLRGALSALLAEQHDDGCFEGEMVWCTMILSQYVIVQRLLHRDIPAERAAGMIRHYQVSRRPDGSYGLHGESGGYVFTTTLAYVALRLLGLPADHPLCAGAHAWLRAARGGVLSNPTWGKLWLALCGLYEYDGINPFPPELFLLPEALPIHPNRYYCHTRYIYLAIASLYGARYQGDLGPLRDALRHELFQLIHQQPYAAIDFAAHRHDLAETDVYARPSLPLRLAYEVLRGHERVHSAGLRRRALAHCFERVLYEQRASRYQGLSPVNALLNCLVIAAAGTPAAPHAELQPSLEGLEAWRWEDAAEGVRYAGARSNAWDTAFSMQALLAALRAETDRTSPAALRAIEGLRRAYGYLRDSQLREDLPGHDSAVARRDPTKGGWCFSDGRHRWPVSDCTAEALSAVLEVGEIARRDPSIKQHLLPDRERINSAWLYQAARFVLQRQNADGGFGSYERRRAGALLDRLNPSEMYGSCMTERSYVECTASCVEALCRFRGAFPIVYRREIDAAIARAVGLLRSAQRSDGAWPGFWGINFTYGTFHAVRALHAAGVPAEDPALQAAGRWLVQHQRADGGWGERYEGCLTGEYAEHPQSQVVMTCWALLALQQLLPAGAAPVARGVAWLRAQQLPGGGFPQQAQNGVFFGTAMLDYRLYKSYFPLWVLAQAPPAPPAQPSAAS